MKRLPAQLLWTATLLMEASWLCAWASFSLDAIVQRRYALLDTIAVFGIGSAVAHWTRTQNWSRARVLLVHVVGISVFVLRDIQIAWGGLSPQGRSAQQWFAAVLFCSWTLVLWIRSVHGMDRTKTYAEVCSRFDLGLSWYFALLFTKLLLTKSAGVHLTDSSADWMLLPFFFFGLVAIAVARNTSGGQKQFMNGYRGITLVATFGFVVVGAAGALLVLVPNLRGASEGGLRGMSAVGGPIADVIARVLILLFGTWLHFDLPPPQPPSDTRGAATRGSGHVLHQVDRTFVEEHSAALNIVAVSLVMSLLGATLWYARHWLFGRPRPNAPPGDALSRVLSWLRRAWARLQAICAELKQARRESELIRFYRALLAWGRRSGLPKRPSETPLEYARRLKQHVGSAGSHVDQIVLAFNLHVYAEVDTSRQEVRSLRPALRALRSPRLWPVRLRMRLSSDGGALSAAPLGRTGAPTD